MNLRRASLYAVASSVIVVAACTDTPTPNEPSVSGLKTSAERSQVAQDRLAALFPDVSSEILSMPGTVYADNDEARGKLVFGVENANAIPGITRSLIARGLSAEEFVVQVTAPIRQMATLQSEFRPTIGGIQIHFPGFLCTMGFNVDHAGGRSFITNSHCTTNQGGVDNTPYYQPLSSVNPTVIATEVADPVYQSGIPGCSAGKVCRSADASRALYNSSTASSRGIIAKTTGVNTGSLTTSGNFTITAQDDANTNFSGTINKVGRTTGWTAGTVSGTCVTVNVSGSNVQELCQTLVTNNSANIVGSGDSGSPVFKITSGDNVTLVGILWGGGGSTQFVFSPLSNIENELGAVVATSDGSGGGGGGDPPPPPPPCKPRGNSGICK